VARILIIDDEDRYRSALRRALELEGHDVAEAPDGDAGLDAYRAQPADVVLLDMFMPGRDGVETLRALRDEFPDAKVIAVSGGGEYGQVEVLRAARVFGARHTLVKPFPNEKLLEAIDRLA